MKIRGNIICWENSLTFLFVFLKEFFANKKILTKKLLIMEKKIRDFKCPHCDGYLKVNNKIILLFENETQKREKVSLVLLDPNPGNYETIIHKQDLPANGDVLKLICPMCYVDLDSPVKEGLCEVDVVAEDGNTGKLYFAPNMGDHATIVVWDEEKINFFGKDIENYYSLFPGFEVHEGNHFDAETARTTHM